MTSVEGRTSPVRRTIARLQAAADKVAVDLNESLGESWTCVVSKDYVLTVTGPLGNAKGLLPTLVEDEGWFVQHGAPAAVLAASLSDDADEVVAREVLALLRAQGWQRPECRLHGADLESSEGFWVCPGDDDAHDVGAVGRLSAASRPKDP